MSQWRNFQLTTFLLPLPFGANTDWAWPVFAAAIMLMLGFELRSRSRLAIAHMQTGLVLPEPFRASTWILTALVLIQSWVLIQWLSGMSIASYDTMTALLKGMGYSAYFALSLLILDSRERVERIVWVAIIAASFQAFYGSIMVMTGWEYGFFTAKEFYIGNATGTFVNRNSLAGYLEMVLALGIGVLIAQSADYRGNFRQRLRQFVRMLLSPKVIVRLLLAMMVIALVMSRSRMGNTAFFASMMITGALALVLMRHKTMSTTILLGSLLVIDITIVGAFFGINKVAERIEQTSSESEQRDEMVMDTLAMWETVPLTGVGAGALMTNFSRFKKEVTMPLWIDHAHNDYVEFLAEFGAPAFLLMLSVVLASLWNAITAMRTRRSDFYKGLGFGCCMGMIAIGIHSTVDFNLQIPANAFMFMLLLALANIARYAPHESGSAVTSSHSARRHQS